MSYIYILSYLAVVTGIFGCLWIIFSAVNGEAIIKESAEKTGPPLTENEYQQILSYMISTAAVVSIFWPLAFVVFGVLFFVGRKRLSEKLDQYKE